MARPKKSWTLSATVTDGPESIEDLLSKKALVGMLKRALHREDLTLTDIVLEEK